MDGNQLLRIMAPHTTSSTPLLPSSLARFTLSTGRQREDLSPWHLSVPGEPVERLGGHTERGNEALKRPFATFTACCRVTRRGTSHGYLKKAKRQTTPATVTAVEKRHTKLCQRQGKMPMNQTMTASKGQIWLQKGKPRNLISDRQAATKQWPQQLLIRSVFRIV